MSQTPVSRPVFRLDDFEGPLDLLLHLVETEELDIHDIPVARLTDQYMNRLRQSLEFEMDIASEFLVMAATLLAWKARALLPVSAPSETLPGLLEGDAPDSEIPDLARLLVTYRAFKRAAEHLAALESERSVRAGRIPTLRQTAIFSGPDQLTLFPGRMEALALRRAYQGAATRTRKADDVRIARDRESIAQRMRGIESVLRSGPHTFRRLLRRRDRREIATVFVCVLELARQGRISFSQEEQFGDLWIEWILKTAH